MLKVCKFGGSSVAGAEQFRKVRDIVLSDDSRRVVVISAAGKRTSDDHKLTDLLYLCHAHLTYGVSCAEILAAIRSRFVSIRDELGLSYRVEDHHTKSERMRLRNQRLQFFLRAEIRLHAVVVDRVVPVVGIRPQNRI